MRRILQWGRTKCRDAASSTSSSRSRWCCCASYRVTDRARFGQYPQVTLVSFPLRPADRYIGNGRTPLAAPEENARLSGQANRRLRKDSVGCGVAGEVRSGLQEVAGAYPLPAGGAKALGTAGATGSSARTTLLDGMDHAKRACHAPSRPT